MATDGASVVRSPVNGLVGKLSYKIPHLKSIHCVAHKATLGLKDLTQNFTKIK